MRHTRCKRHVRTADTAWREKAYIRPMLIRAMRTAFSRIGSHSFQNVGRGRRKTRMSVTIVKIEAEMTLPLSSSQWFPM